MSEKALGRKSDYVAGILLFVSMCLLKPTVLLCGIFLLAIAFNPLTMMLLASGADVEKSVTGSLCVILRGYV